MYLLLNGLIDKRTNNFQINVDFDINQSVSKEHARYYLNNLNILK